MDSVFHIQQGQEYLTKQDEESMEKALNHFISANKMIEEGDVQKPLVLFYLALVNYQIGNIALSYKITQKAKRNVDLVIKNNPFLIDRMKDSSFEEELDGLINYIKESYPQVIMFIDEDDDNFNENTILLDNYSIRASVF